MEHIETAQNPAVPSSTATPLQAGGAQAGAPRSTAVPLQAGAQPGALRSAGASRSSGAEHRARAEWLVGELRRMAAGTDNPVERANLKRSADSLIRLATAYRP